MSFWLEFFQVFFLLLLISGTPNCNDHIKLRNNGSCDEDNGYNDDDDNFSTGLPAFLLYAARTYVKRITLGDHVETTIPLGGGLRNAIALDYDYQQNCIYWADITLDTIKRSFLNGSGEQPITR